MRILVTGMNGQVGRELRAADWPAGAHLIAFDRDALDLGDKQTVAARVAEVAPDVVINAAAYTAVDRAEDEPETAYRVNRDGPAALAAACEDSGAALVHISTDYVFDGTKDGPWTPEDTVRPLGTYGASKAAGEDAVRASVERHVILRTAWVHAAHGHNFVRTMLKHGAQKDQLKVVGDQFGGPTAADDIAAALVGIADHIVQGKTHWGTYHFCGAPRASWYDFAQAVFDRAEPVWGRRPEVARITSAEWPTPVTRPANSVLDCMRLKADYGIEQPDWRARLTAIVARLVASHEGKV